MVDGPRLTLDFGDHLKYVAQFLSKHAVYALFSFIPTWLTTWPVKSRR